MSVPATASHDTRQKYRTSHSAVHSISTSRAVLLRAPGTKGCTGWDPGLYCCAHLVLRTVLQCAPGTKGSTRPVSPYASRPAFP
eukprot:56209-Rhodomonas_salina.1